MKKSTPLIVLFIITTCVIAVAMGFSDILLSNYFKDAYNATAQQRGFIEIPRELPGVIAIFIIMMLARLGDIRIAIFAHTLSAIGILVLAVWTPSFYTMTAVLFVFSLGMHTYMPLQESLSISILGGNKNPNLGSILGKIKGMYTLFSLVAGAITFIGFRYSFFSFKTPVKIPFIVAGVGFIIAVILFIIIYRLARGSSVIPKTSKPVIRKEYKLYYILAVVFGVQKQIVFVYSPWLLIELLGFGADSISLLIMLSSLIGIFFLPFLGRCLDRFGLKAMLYVDAISFIAVYLLLAFMAYNFHVGRFATVGIAVIITSMVFVVDRVSSQMGFIRTVYLSSIAVNKEEIVSTISFGISLDHVVAVIASFLCGLVWAYIGPQYVFIIAASISLINLAVARVIPKGIEKSKVKE